MSNVIQLFGKTEYTLIDAQNVVHSLNAVTKRYSTQVESLIARIDSAKDQTLIATLETEVNALIQKWQDRVQALGAHPKGLWIADIDSGTDYFCWKYPETKLEFRHSYTQGVSKRVRI